MKTINIFQKIFILICLFLSLSNCRKKELNNSLYTVSFEMNGGASSINSQIVASNTIASAPSAPTKIGFTFGGWYSDVALTIPFDFATPITANTTLYAKWTAPVAPVAPVTYTVTFSVDGGSAVTSQTVTSGTAATSPKAPTKTGFNFGGWYSDSALTTAFSFSTPITANTTLYAKWSIKSFTVSFNSNGSSAVPPISNVKYNTTVSQPSTPEKTAFLFDGWFSDVALTIPFNFTTPIISDTTLFAKWTLFSFHTSSYLQYNNTLVSSMGSIAKLDLSKINSIKLEGPFRDISPFTAFAKYGGKNTDNTTATFWAIGIPTNSITSTNSHVTIGFKIELSDNPGGGINARILDVRKIGDGGLDYHFDVEFFYNNSAGFMATTSLNPSIPFYEGEIGVSCIAYESQCFPLTSKSLVATKQLMQNEQIYIFIPFLASAGTGVSPYNYSISPTLPSGLSFNATTGAISGTPTTIQAETNYTITVRDATGASLTSNYSMSIISPESFVTIKYRGEPGLYTCGHNLDIIVPKNVPITLPDANSDRGPYWVDLTTGYQYWPGSSFTPTANITLNCDISW